MRDAGVSLDDITMAFKAQPDAHRACDPLVGNPPAFGPAPHVLRPCRRARRVLALAFEGLGADARSLPAFAPRQFIRQVEVAHFRKAMGCWVGYPLPRLLLCQKRV